MEQADYKDAIVEAMHRSTKGNMESESDAKKRRVGK